MYDGKVNKRKRESKNRGWKTKAHKRSTKARVVRTINGYEEHDEVEENLEDYVFIIFTILIVMVF